MLFSELFDFRFSFFYEQFQIAASLDMHSDLISKFFNFSLSVTVLHRVERVLGTRSALFGESPGRNDLLSETEKIHLD